MCDMDLDCQSIFMEINDAFMDQNQSIEYAVDFTEGLDLNLDCFFRESLKLTSANSENCRDSNYKLRRYLDKLLIMKLKKKVHHKRIT